MNLYLLKRTDNVRYDEYNSDVVAAESFEQAKEISRVGDYKGVVVSQIGTAIDGLDVGVILDSFMAG